MIRYLKEDNFNEQTATGTILVDFYADWCGPCKMLGKILEEMDLDIDVLKVNTDEYTEIALSYGVMSIPTLILIKDGNTAGKMIGVHNKDEILEFIENNK